MSELLEHIEQLRDEQERGAVGTCDDCATEFRRRALYEQHLNRREQHGFCLGEDPPDGAVVLVETSTMEVL